jgi:protein tyrosine kinase modulator
MSITDDAKGPRDYLAAVLRRKFRLVIPAVLIIVISLVVAMAMPPVYRSTGTVLIEEPEIPREFIRSTITSFAAERLQIIQQRVMTTQNLISIINKFNLYPDERKRKPLAEIAGGFRDKIAMQLVSAEVVDPRSGQQRKAVIAFNVSFDDGNRAVAQKVANELVSLYLNENLRIRRERAAETTGFLGEEANRLGKQVSDLESRMADFKRRNSGVLPDQLGLNMSALSRTQAQLSDANRRLQALDERRIVLQSQLSQLNPHGTQVVDGQTVLSPVDRLKALETRLISMRGIYGPQHPDVVKTEHEIEVLKKETGGGTSVNALKTQLQTIEGELSVQRKRYGDKYPDVLKLERQAKSLRSAIRSGKDTKDELAAKPDNPSYIMTQSQLKTLQAEMDAVNKEREGLQASLKEYEERVLKIPENEREYLSLKRDYENASSKYRDVRSKQLEAQLAEAMETERKGERFSLIEPPQMPIEPIRPNRLAIVFIGFVFAGAAGVGNVFLAEALDESIYGSKGLAAVVGQAPLVVIPVLGEQRDERPKRWPWIALGAAVFVIILAGGLYAYHHYVKPLDVMWFSTLRRFGLG